MTFDFKQIIDNISNIEGLENTTILKTLKEFEKYILENAVKGATGERGPQGIQGPEGPQGLRGPKGDSGATLNSFEFTPNTNGASYSDEQMTMTGKLTFSVLVNGVAEYHTINATIKTNITGSEDIILDTNEDGTAIEIHLDNDVRNKLAKALVTPMSAPTSTELVGINSTNAQVGIAIGEGLELDGNTLKSTGGSGGGGRVVVETYTLSQLQSLYNKLSTLYQNDKSKILKLSAINKGTNDYTIQVSTKILSATTSESSTEDVVIIPKTYTDFYPGENNFVFQRNNRDNTLIRFNIDREGYLVSISVYVCTPSGTGNIIYGSAAQGFLNPSSYNFEFKLYYFE